MKFNEVVNKIKEQVNIDSNDSLSRIPNIIDFCNSKKYLNLSADGVSLYPMQQLILKCFYRKQTGNENLELTPEEIHLLESNNMTQVLDKYNSEAIFRELVLVLGRRCISEDSTLCDKNGKINKIGDLWDNNIRNIGVYSLNEIDYKIYYIENAEIILNGIQPVYSVTLTDGRNIDVTDNHPFLTVEGWKLLKDLKIKDKIAVPNNKLKTHGKDKDSNDILWIPIKSIEYKGKQRTFDISVPKENHHNFIANDIILHNSGKDFLTGIIACYETMKLLECPGGSPFSYFGLAKGNPIHILTIATSADQAKILFNEIKTRMQASEYFLPKIKNIESEKIWLMTPEDRKIEAELKKNKQTVQGSICVRCGHSNSEGLLGKRVWTLLLDEVASFKDSGGSSSGERLYTALGPCTSDFKKPNSFYIDPSDNRKKAVYDSKIISISSPRSEDGILYKLYSTADESFNRLVFRLPTWKVNSNFDEESLRSEFKYMSATEFSMEFGAEFSGMSGEKYIPDHYLETAQNIGRSIGIKQEIQGHPYVAYYAHLDPATTSHNYALCVVHMETRVRNKETAAGTEKEKYNLFVVDHLKFWTPSKNQVIKVSEVDEYIIDLAKRFRFKLVTYDDWNSASSIEKLRKKNIPTKITKFRSHYIAQIYDNLESLLVNQRLALPYKSTEADLLFNELKYLKRIYTPKGFKITVDKEAPVRTDDLCDALAGALYSALDVSSKGFPMSGTVYMPQTRSTDNQWNIGRGQFSQSQWQFLSNKTK